MKTPSSYRTATAFRHALEDRLKAISKKDGTDLTRLRRRVAFDRFLARLFARETPKWLLKGGYAMEIRLSNLARTTKDIDLSLTDDVSLGTPEKIPSTVLELLRDAAEQALKDWFTFYVGESTVELHLAPTAGARYPIDCLVDQRRFIAFHLDVGVGDVVSDNPEPCQGHDLLRFAGIHPARVMLIPMTVQFAEKLHALTLPRGDRDNTRVKDLADLILMLQHGIKAGEKLRQAVQATFARRATHPVPSVLPSLPLAWTEAYSGLARELHLEPASLDEVVRLLNNSLNILRS
jgi:hypothetical protein